MGHGSTRNLSCTHGAVPHTDHSSFSMASGNPSLTTQRRTAATGIRLTAMTWLWLDLAMMGNDDLDDDDVCAIWTMTTAIGARATTGGV